MKTKLIILTAITIGLLQSCAKSGEIQIQNKISNVKITDVYWGKYFIESELLPGETSSKTTIGPNDETLPSSQKVSFRMTANNKTIYLETEKMYVLNEDDKLLIILTDTTKVKNPNE